MAVFKDPMERDNEIAQMMPPFAPMEYHRPGTGVTRTIPVDLQDGDFSRDKSFRSSSEARSRLGSIFVFASALSDFGGEMKYQDRVTDPSGRVWTVLGEESRDQGLIEAQIEADLRTVF
jgi:hypothetical protein